MKLRRSLAVLAAAPLLMLAGCGGDSNDLVAETTPSSGPSAGDSTGAGTGDSGGDSGAALTQDTFASAVLKATRQAKTAHLSASISAAGQQLTMDGDVEVGDDPADYAADITLSVPSLGDALHMVLVDEVIYMNLGALTQDKFVKIESGRESPFGDLSQLTASADPAAGIKALEDGVTAFEKRGTEQIDGVETTHYRVTVDTQRVLKAQGMADLYAGGAGGGPQLPATLDYDLWIGSDNLLRRTQFAMGQDFTMLVDTTAWGESVNVSAPPLNQVSKADPFAGIPTG